MSPDVPPAPPEAEVIRLARKAMDMTAEAAAEATRAHDGKGVSATYWRDVERGYGGRRGQRVQTRASDRALAAMARVVHVSPAQLTEAGREDAARVLREIERREHPAPAPPATADEPAVPEPDDDLRLSPAARKAADRHLPDIIRLVDTALLTNPGTLIPEGSQIFGNPAEAERWDRLVHAGRTLYPGQGFPLPKLIKAAAHARGLDEQYAAQQAANGRAAG